MSTTISRALSGDFHTIEAALAIDVCDAIRLYRQVKNDKNNPLTEERKLAKNKAYEKWLACKIEHESLS